MPASRVSPLLGGLAVVAAYMVARHFTYRAMPVHIWPDLIRQDLVVTVWRLAALVALMALNRRWWRQPGFEFHRREWKMTAGYGGSLMAVTLAYLVNFDPPFYPAPVAGVMMITTIAVGGFEEYAFRGVIFGALRERLSPVVAVLVSSVVFTVFHWEAQPLEVWPQIFLIGVFFANLRLRGMSLGALAIIHTIYDDLYFLSGMEPPQPHHLYQLGFHLGLCGLAVVSWPRGKLAASPTTIAVT